MKHDRTSVTLAVLGWSNPDTGPSSVRLYGLDQGESPRWARPHARVVEQSLGETTAAVEGDRFLVVNVGDRGMTLDELAELAERVREALDE